MIIKCLHKQKVKLWTLQCQIKTMLTGNNVFAFTGAKIGSGDLHSVAPFLSLGIAARSTIIAIELKEGR